MTGLMSREINKITQYVMLFIVYLQESLTIACFLTTGNIPLPKGEERTAMLKNSEF